MLSTVSLPFLTWTTARSTSRSLSRTRRLWITMAFFAVFAGAWARLYDLDRFGFWTDEMFHVLAANSELTTGVNTVPMHGPYSRALPITGLTFLSFNVLGVSETAARLPFALWSIGFLVLGFFIVRGLMGLPVAAMFTLVMALSPLSVMLARECRMYIVFQSLYFCMSYAFFLGLERPPVRSRLPSPLARFETRHNVNLLMIAASFSLFLAASAVHILAYTFVFVIVAYCVVMGAAQWRDGRPARASVFKYEMALSLLAIAFLAIFVLKSGLILNVMDKGLAVPNWVPSRSIHYYRYLINNQYPAFYYLFPAGVLILLKRHGRLGLFTVLSFLVLFVMHSAVFGRKDDRYISYIYPFFFLTAVVAIDLLIPVIRLTFSRMVRGERLWTRRGFALLALPAVLIFMNPWLDQTRASFRQSRFPDWKSVDVGLRKQIGASGVVTTAPRSHIYYFGSKPDFYFMNERKPRWVYEPGLVTNFLDLKRALTTPGIEYFVCDRWSFSSPAFLTEKMRQYVSSVTTEVSHSGDPRILIFKLTGATDARN